MKKHGRTWALWAPLAVALALMIGMIPALGENTITSDPIAVPDADPDEETLEQTGPTITGFEEVSPIELEPLTYKPDQAVAAQLFPQTLTAKLSDETTISLAVTWTCESYDTGLDGVYEFACALPEDAPTLDEGVTLPVGRLTVAPGKSGEYSYRLNEQDELTIIGWEGTQTDLIVPAELEGHPVIAIGDAAFAGKSLLTLELPNTLKRVGNGAFSGCAQLTRLVFPDSLESAGADLIKDDAALTALVLRSELDTTMTRAEDGSAYILTRAVPATEGEQAPAPITFTLPFEPTDIRVLAGTLSLDADFTIAAEHSITVEATGTLNLVANRTLTNLGTISNLGALNNSGTIVNCAGQYTGNDAVSVNGFYVTDHNWVDGHCSVCGVEQPEDNKVIEITYVGDGITKVYDATRNVTDLSGSDFTIDKSQLTLGTSVRIRSIRAAYDSPDAGDARTVTIQFTLRGDDAERYTPQDLVLVGAITPKVLTVTPTEGQSKVYGAKDPSYFGGKVKGLLSGDSMVNSRLGREPGENVGTYRIVQGTLDAGPNYQVEIAEGYFTITPKDIGESGVNMATISNQRYTGSAITPDVTIRYAGAILQNGVDYKLSYASNVDPGTATVTVTGIGNFTGERTASFRILNIVTDFDDTSGPDGGGTGIGGGSIIDDPSFWDQFDYEDGPDGGDGEGDSTDTPDGVRRWEHSRLRIGGVDYGNMVYDINMEPLPFDVEAEDEEGVIHVIAQPAEDAETGEVLMQEDGVREQYGEQHLRLTPELVEQLMDEGYTTIVYELEYASLTLPLAALPMEAEVIPMDEAAPGGPMSPGPAGPMEPIEAPEEVEMDIQRELRPVEVWDFRIAQPMDEASVYESIVLEGYVPATVPYELMMVAETRDPEPGLQTISVYPEGAALNIEPLEVWIDVPEDAMAVSQPLVLTPENDVVIEPATVTGEALLTVEFVPTADGTYLAYLPEKTGD